MHLHENSFVSYFFYYLFSLALQSAYVLLINKVLCLRKQNTGRKNNECVKICLVPCFDGCVAIHNVTKSHTKITFSFFSMWNIFIMCKGKLKKIEKLLSHLSAGHTNKWKKKDKALICFRCFALPRTSAIREWMNSNFENALFEVIFIFLIEWTEHTTTKIVKW